MTTLADPPSRTTLGTPGPARHSVSEPELPPDRPRSVSARTADDWLTLIGAFVASLALDWLIYTQLTPFSGKLGFAVGWYLLFVLLYGGLTAMSQPMVIVKDRIASALVQGAAGVVGFCLVATLVYVFVKGYPAYSHVNFFTSDMSSTAQEGPLDHGGILHAIVGSLIEIGLAVAISLPLGVATAVYMTEVGGRLSQIVRTVIEAMTALPDLVAGLFIYTTLIVALGSGRSGLTAALAIAITMLPIIARSSEVVLRVVPGGLREASLALGASQWRTVLFVVLPTARAGLGTALILGAARGIGETAPVLIAAAQSTFFTANPFDSNKPMNSLPLFIYRAVRSGQPVYETRAYGAAAVLMTMVLILFVIVRIVSRQRGQSR